MAAYDAEIRVKTKVDNGDVIKLEAVLNEAEKQADDLGDAMKDVQLNRETAEAAQQAATAVNHLERETRKAASAAGELEDAWKNTKIHLNDGSTLDWDGNVIEEAVKDTAALNREQSGLADTAARAAEAMRRMGEETRAANAAAYGADAAETEKELTPVQNMLSFIKKSFQDIPLLFGGIADKFTSKARQMQDEWDNLSNRADAYKRILKELESEDKGFGDREYDEAYKEWQKAEQAVREYKKQLTGAKKQHISLLQGMKNLRQTVSGAFRKMTAVVKKFFSSTQSGAKKTGGMLGTMASRMKGLALSLLFFNWISKGFNAMVSGTKNGFKALSGYSREYASSVQTLKNALGTLGNSFASAFAPIIQAVIPYLVELINWVTRAINAVAQLIACLSGKGTWTKATEVQNGYNDALNGTASAAKKAAGALAKFDDLDVLQKKDTAGGGGGVTGGFEELPIDSDIEKFADRLKDIMSKLFNPFRKAWEEEGKFVMDSWKYALDEIWKLMKDIGRDFLTVWNQEATIQMFADILHIIGDIGLVVGNLARNFREAWNENETGLRILENIRDIFAIIIRHIRNAADATVEWSDKLNFSPVLAAFKDFTESLKPVVDAISGIFEDFYTKVLLPLGKWTIEKGLPELLQIMTDFNNKVDWAKIRQDLSDFWKSLEPFAETVGEGLLIFLDDLSELVADFMNSEALDNFLDHLAEWMDNVEPEDIAEGIKKLAIAFIALKGALIVLDGAIAASKVVAALGGIASAFKILKGAIQKAVLFIQGINIGQVFAGMNPAMLSQIAVDVTDLIRGTWLDPSSWNNPIGELIRYIGGVHERLWDAVYDFLDDFGGNFKKAVATILDLSWVKELFDKALQNFSDAFSGKDIGWNLVKGLFNGISAALGFLLAPIVNLFKSIIEGVLELFGVHSPSTVFYDIGYYLIEGLLLGIQETWQVIVEFFQMTLDSIILFFVEKWEFLKETTSEVWNSIALFFSETWTGIQETASEIWEPIKEFIIETWTVIKDKAIEIWEIVKVTFTEKFDAIKTKVEEIMTKFDEFKLNVKRIFENVKEKIISTLDPVINKIQGFIDKIKEAIQAMKDWAAEKIEGIGNFIGGVLGGNKSSRAAMPSAASYSLNNLNKMSSIPHLATGAVIRGGNPFMAVLGDQPSGQTNIEAPLSTIREAVREELSGLNFGNGGQAKVVLRLNGQDVGEAIVEDLLSVMNRKGYDVEVLGVT